MSSAGLRRKAGEFVVARRLERFLDKDRILELYLNKIYLGQRAYGVEAAARVYYGESISELSLADNTLHGDIVAARDGSSLRAVIEVPQARLQPLKKTVVRMPGPSSVDMR